MQTVSIFIPVYNAEAFLEDTIKSVLAQTFQNWELLIIDDCSTDKSFDIAERYAANYSGIQVIKNDHNLGMMANWNKGIELCHQPYFVKLDADDLWEVDFLEKSLVVLENYPNVGLVFTKYVKIDENGIAINESDIPLPLFAKNKSFSCVPLVTLGPGKMLSYPILQQGLSVIRKDVFTKVGKYRYLITKDTQAATDTEFYFRVGAHFDIYCINETLYKYRVHDKSISATDKNKMIGDQKVYETQRCIIEYYTVNGLLDESLARHFLKDLELRFSFSKIAYFKNTHQRMAFFKSLTIIALSNPLKTMKFYINRLLQKIPNNGQVNN